jgi:hypothetical protein
VYERVVQLTEQLAVPVSVTTKVTGPVPDHPVVESVVNKLGKATVCAVSIRRA